MQIKKTKGPIGLNFSPKWTSLSQRAYLDLRRNNSSKLSKKIISPEISKRSANAYYNLNKHQQNKDLKQEYQIL